ncbi:MAG: sigma-70 family RNA polymerase sigma factor [Oscillospiraceae bacterium]
MNGLENKKLEHEALQEFVGLLDPSGSMSTRVHGVIREELTERQEELIRLYYFEQMSMTEIAQRLGLSPSTVSRTIKRGRERLCKYLKYNGRYLVRSMLD